MRTKSVEQSIQDTDEPDTRPRKDLGTWHLIVVGVAVGIFTLAASTAGDVAGPSVSLAFVIAAIACVAGVLRVHRHRASAELPRQVRELAATLAG